MGCQHLALLVQCSSDYVSFRAAFHPLSLVPTQANFAWSSPEGNHSLFLTFLPMYVHCIHPVSSPPTPYYLPLALHVSKHSSSSTLCIYHTVHAESIPPCLWPFCHYPTLPVAHLSLSSLPSVLSVSIFINASVSVPSVCNPKYH